MLFEKQHYKIVYTNKVMDKKSETPNFTNPNAFIPPTLKYQKQMNSVYNRFYGSNKWKMETS